MKITHLNNKYLAEIIGILLGDGSIGVYKCRNEKKISIQHRVKITLNSKDDLQYSFYIQELIKNLFGIKTLRRFRSNENTFDILSFNKEFLQFLTNDIGLVLSPKWERARIPDFCFRHNLELQVLKGYFDTDGCIAIVNNNGTIYPRLEMKVCPSPMQKQFLEILRKYNFRFGAYKIGKGKVRIQLNGVQELRKWCKLIGFSNKKNIERAKQFL